MARPFCPDTHLRVCFLRLSLGVLSSLAFAVAAHAQTATYRLHKEASSTSGLFQLKTANPDAASFAVQSANLNGSPIGEYIIKAFVTQSGVPNASGAIPAGSTVTFALWLKKTATAGTMFPRAKLRLNSSTGASVCTFTGSTALTTTLTKYTLTCTVPANVPMITADRFYLWVGINLTAVSGVNNRAELDIEGTLNGNYDSLITVPLPVPPPSISSLSPTSGTVGTAVTITGSNFGATQGSSTVTFNGTAATPTSWSVTSIVAPVPASATTGSVRVTVNGQASNGVTFTVKPKINSLTPTSGAVGTSVTIAGTTFGATQGTSTVTFNGTTATPSSWSATSIVAPVPSGATTGAVVVTVSGQASNGVTFTVTPKINSLSPTSGAVGTSVTIAGTTFGATQGTSTVTFNGTAAAPTSWNATSIAAPVPSGATTGAVVVTVNGQTSNGVTFTVTPKINSLSPTSGSVGDAVTISGTTFGATQGTSTVTFNGTAATPTSWSATSIAAPVPSGATTGAVVVTVSGQASNGVTFTVTPKIISLSPTSGAVSDAVTIAGTTFGATQGTSTVTFNGTTATPTSWSATSIAAPVPSGATTGAVVVTVNGQASNGVTFTVTPKINSLSPTSGSVSDSVTISGTTFGATQGTSTITFNGTTATPASWSATSIAASVPSGATTGAVVITVSGQASNGVTFTVTPKINSLSPTSGSVSDSVTISGTTFGATQGTNTVAFNGTTATPTSWSDTSVVAAVPAGSTTGPVIVTAAGQASNGVTFTVITPGTIAGTITRTSDSAALNGALVEAVQAGVVKASTTTAANGSYAIAAVVAGTYDVRASAIGYQTGMQNGVIVTENTTTTVNQSLGAVSASDIIYIYDELGRLVSVVTPAETVTYAYDAVGNLLSISRQNSNLPSISEFTPNGGTVGASVTIYGTGFSTTASQNIVAFNGVTTTVTSATATQIVTIVPTAATTGPISVNTPTGLATSSTPFTVTASAAPTITSFSPTIGVIGTPVTINGTNFETSPANDKVTFNTAYALVDSATATNIATSPPALGTSGRISVATPNGKAISSADFFVPPSPYTSTDIEATGRMSLGETRTVSITSPGKLGLMLFDGAVGGRVSLTVNTSTITSTRVTIYNPSGTSLASGLFNTSGGFMDTPLLPATGTYTILIAPDGPYTGSISFTLYDATDVKGTITPNGPPVTVTTTILGQNAQLTFSGAAGQRVSLKINSLVLTGGYYNWANVTINKPDGTSLASGTFDSGGGFLDVQSLPVAGTYTILADPRDTSTGSITLTLYDVPADVTGTITAGGAPATVTTAVPGQNAQLTFSGAAGQRVSLKISGVVLTGGFNNWANVTIKKPDGTSLASGTFDSGGGFLEVQTLPVAGTYTILADPWNTSTGSITLTLYDVPADVTGTITPGGAPATVTMAVPGQNAQLTFSGAAGQRVSLNISGVVLTGGFNNWVNVAIKKPDGSSLASGTFDSGGGFLDVQSLPVAGTYTILADPWNTSTGSITLTLYDVPADVTGTITPSGAPATVTMTVPGQNAQLTFSGAAGQRVSLQISGVVLTGGYNNWVNVAIKKPDGSSLASGVFDSGGGFFDVQTLPVAGTYTILADPWNTSTGSITLTLYDVPADASNSTTIGAAAVSVTTTVPGQNAQVTFAGTSGQQVTVHLTGNTMGTVYVRLLNPDGTVLTSNYYNAGSFDLPIQTLPANGSYTVSIDPQGTNAGNISVAVTNP